MHMHTLTRGVYKYELPYTFCSYNVEQTGARPRQPAVTHALTIYEVREVPLKTCR